MSQISNVHQKVDPKKFGDNYDRIFGKKELPGKDDNEDKDPIDSVDDSTNDESGSAG